MAHIHTMPGGHDLTVSAFIIRRDPTPLFLVHRHKKLSLLMQPGGHVETCEDPWSGLVHEIREETGYSPDQLSVLQPMSRLADTAHNTMHPVPVSWGTHQMGEDHFHSDAAYALATDQLPRHQVAEGESEELWWLPVEELERRTDVLRDSARLARVIHDHVLDAWQPVPAVEYTLRQVGGSPAANS